ncbi:MAG: dihydrofolate reductase [Chloracidobacterium sp.]|nr:dihydrofolate reductase [Chloracidobacterium sp.]
MITGIVAIAKNHAIGRDGKLPWHYSADLKFFKETTTGNAVVMGANTWRSIGRPLPNRLNIVLSRSGNVDTPEGVVKLNNKQAVIDLAKHAKGDIFIIGGAQVYRDLADIIDKWIVTEIPTTVEDADTFMPEDFLDKFELEKTIDLGDELTVKILHRG